MRTCVSPASSLRRQWRRLVLRARSERGAVMVIVAGAMVILLGMAGLALDSGRAFLVKSELARAVDAGVRPGPAGRRVFSPQGGSGRFTRQWRGRRRSANHGRGELRNHSGR